MFQVPLTVMIGLIKLTSLAVKSAEKMVNGDQVAFSQGRGKCLTNGRLKVSEEKVKGRCEMHRLMICLVDLQEYRWLWRTCWCMEW